MTPNGSGFALIELLVVIAMIAILVRLLLPPCRLEPGRSDPCKKTKKLANSLASRMVSLYREQAPLRAAGRGWNKTEHFGTLKKDSLLRCPPEKSGFLI